MSLTGGVRVTGSDVGSTGMGSAASAARGLTSAEVAERTEAGQTNAFVQDTSRSVWSIVRANVLTLFNAIILVCFVVLFAIGRWQDALFGFSAVANAIIGSVQEYRAKRALDRLAVMNAPHARVLRDAAEAEIDIAGVVLGDTIVLRAYDQIAADALVSGSRGLQVDESMLTGESDAVEKAPGDRVLSGSIVVGGEGSAEVDRVGADSFANSLSAQAKKFSLVASELRSSINRVLKWVAWFIGPVSLLVLNAQMMTQRGGWAGAVESGAWRDAAVATIASVVAMVPLGLVLMTSITFAVGAVKLARQQVLVQELAAVEGLARVDMICLDKTGTLTHGDIVFDEVHPLAEAPGWHGVLAWYGVQNDANATARSLAGRFTDIPGASPPIGCRSRRHASGAPSRSTTACGCSAGPRWCSPPSAPLGPAAAAALRGRPARRDRAAHPRSRRRNAHRRRDGSGRHGAGCPAHVP